MIENELILGEENESLLTTSEISAVELDRSIREHTSAIGEHFVALARSLKEMRDGKYYKELGYNSFDAYVEGSGHPFKARQAYSYISVYESYEPKFLAENASLGVTKLEMLKAIFPTDRAEFIEQNDVENMSTRELKEALEKIKEQGEQISFLTTENEKLKAEKDDTELPAEVLSELNELRKKCESLSVTVSERDKEVDGLAGARLEVEDKLKSAEAEKRRLEQELKDLKDKPVEVAVTEPSEEQLASIRKEITEQVEAEADKRVAEAQKQAEEYKAAADAADELRRKLTAAQNDKVKEFKIYFEDTKSRLEKLFEVLGDIEDADTKARLRSATLAFLESIKKDLEG